MIIKENDHINYPVMLRNQGSTYVVVIYFEENEGRVLVASKSSGRSVGDRVTIPIHELRDWQFLDSRERVTFIQGNIYKND
jgi:hypothetical protein